MFLVDIQQNITLIHAMVVARLRVDDDQGLPLKIMPLNHLSTADLDKLVTVRGMVVSRSLKKPRLVQAYFQCKQCKCIMGPYDVVSAQISREQTYQQGAQDSLTTIIPKQCANEQCGSHNIQLYQSECVYEDMQKLQIQERNEDTEPGFMPEKKELIVSGDLIDTVMPGDSVLVTGVYKLFGQCQDGPFPYFQTVIEANQVQTEQDIGVQLTAQDHEDLKTFAEYFSSEQLDNIIFNSICPSIHGHELAKKSIALSLVGGVSHVITADQPKSRGDIHVLLLGDPGIAKSQLLRYVQNCAPKSVMTAGKGASAAGLTVAVKKGGDGEYSLQAGAMVLANGGVCLIDELDKMNEVDRVALH